MRRLLALVAVLALAGCANDNPDGPTLEGTSPPQTGTLQPEATTSPSADVTPESQLDPQGQLQPSTTLQPDTTTVPEDSL